MTQERTVTLELPYPPTGLSPNARLHWRAKAKLVAEYREHVGWIGVKCCHDAQPLGPPVEADVVFWVPDRRKRDLDNLLASLKPAWDGLCDAGLLPGDDARVFKVASATVQRNHVVGKRVTVTLRCR